MRWASLVLRGEDLAHGISEDLASPSNVFASWLKYATDLLVGRQSYLNAAHNKVKHGLAARSRNDLRITFTTTPPNADGTLPLSAVTGPDSYDLFDRPVLEVLVRPPKRNKQTQGLELTQIRIDVPEVLVEAHMIAWTHGAMFNVAATRHFTGREHLPDHLKPPAHPGYPLGGPLPEHIHSQAPRGLRFPLTTPPGGGPPPPAAVVFRDSYTPIHFTGTTWTGRVVGD